MAGGRGLGINYTSTGGGSHLACAGLIFKWYIRGPVCAEDSRWGHSCHTSLMTAETLTGGGDSYTCMVGFLFL